MSDWDVIVIGGGSAGTSAAATASKAGARTAMINDGELGGLCILRGCMPTKAMLASTHAAHEAKHLDPFGVRLEGRVVVDFERVMQRRGELVARFKRAKLASIEAGGYEVIDARARFAADGTVEIPGARLRARSYVVAVGSRATILPIPGIDDVPVWTSDDVMALTRRPEALVVQGAGPIGLELAQFFARAGTQVTLVNRSPLLSHFDADAGAELTRALEAEDGFELAVPGRIERLVLEGDGLVAEIRTGDKSFRRRADALLMAAGREADLGGLGLEHVGLATDGGLLEHDERMRTAHERIYVAGDATGRHQILHLANQEGRCAGHNAAGGTPERRVDYRLAMSVIFTDPPFAHVGMNAQEARCAGHDVITSVAEFPSTGRAITMGTRFGRWTVVADRRTRRILGSSILGPRADDLIHLISLTMAGDTDLRDIEDLPWYHPTLSEVMLQLGRDLERQAT